MLVTIKQILVVIFIYLEFSSNIFFSFIFFQLSLDVSSFFIGTLDKYIYISWKCVHPNTKSARVQRHMLLLPLGQIEFPVSLDCKQRRPITCKPTDFTWHPTEVVTDISRGPLNKLDEHKRSFMELVSISDFRTVTVHRSDRLIRR